MWEPGETLHVVDGITPVAIHRGGADAAAQARLADYVADLAQRVLPLPDTPLPLFVHLHVQVPRDVNFIHGYVLEPFLAPLFGARCLDAYRFHLVIATKGTTAPSRLTLGMAAAASSGAEQADCKAAPQTAPASKEWVEELRRALARRISIPLPEGPIRLSLSLRCSPKRNWVALWKPAVDAMGPVLGYDHSGDPHHPRSDHLTRLELYRHTAEDMGNSVELEYRWKPATTDTT